MSEFERRRQSFVQQIGDAVAVFPSAPAAIRSNDTDYEYRQDTDFYFLSGFTEPESVLVLAPNHSETRSVLFVRPRDREREVWEGKRAGVEGAVRDFGVDAAYPIAELAERLPSLLDTSDRLYYAFSRNDAFNEKIVQELKRYHRLRRSSDKGPIVVLDPSTILHEMRLRKSSADLAALRRTVKISAQGHVAAMRHARPGMHEYEIEAILEYTFHRLGAQAVAFSSIVASGSNATVLHYETNRDTVGDHDLVLVDAGAELDYYCGDITRTWPISGRFSPEQRVLYEIVLEAQRGAIARCIPGMKFSRTVALNGSNDTVEATAHAAAVKVIVEGLTSLGILKGSFQEIIEAKKYEQFFMHGTGHWLGMDTHDVGFYRMGGDWRALEPGMVLTVEPGIYIPEDADVEDRFKGIGIRIEDDVLVTEGEPEVLSAGAPKSIQELERTIAEGRESNQPLPV